MSGSNENTVDVGSPIKCAQNDSDGTSIDVKVGYTDVNTGGRKKVHWGGVKRGIEKGGASTTNCQTRLIFERSEKGLLVGSWKYGWERRVWEGSPGNYQSQSENWP